MGQAQLIPAVDLDHIENIGEKDVARALVNTLDESWTIFHSYCWLRSEQGYDTTKLVEGETDFILVHRKWGLFVLEVKGGPVQYHLDTGIWMQGHKQMPKDPFKQGQKNMHALIKQIHERAHFIGTTYGKGMPCSFGYLVAFPDCNYSGDLPPGGHPDIVFGAKDLPTLGEAVTRAARHWNTAKDPKLMEPADYKALKRALKSNFSIVASLARRLEKDEETLIQLTADQAEKLRGLYANQRVTVEGVAGSGKTLLALLRAQAFAEEGKEVLFLCYNRKLADALSLRVAHVDNLKIINFHRLCYEMCHKAGLAFDPPSDRVAANAFYRDDVPEMLMDAIDALPEFRYDALVVDEAQDFHDTWWTAIEFLHRERNGPLYIFFDRAQNLFGTEMGFPQTQALYKLDTNCRNTRSIAASCSTVLGAEIRTSRFAPKGERPLLIKTGKAEDIRKQCAAILAHSIGKEGIHPSRVAILCPKGLEHSSLHQGKVGAYKLTDDYAEWQRGKGVWFSTIRSFKGLEADLLLLIDVGDFVPGFFEQYDLYVAASRARHRLVVFSTSAEVSDLLAKQLAGKP